MVLYFTGTGNSRYVAELIAEATGDKLVNISEYTRDGHPADFEEPGPYVFVSPVYVSAPAKPFMEFVKRSSFPRDAKAYFIMTSAASMGGSPEYCRRLSAKKGLLYQGAINVVMPQNYVLLAQAREDEQLRARIEDAQPVIERIVDAIKAGDKLPPDGMQAWEYAACVLVVDFYYKHFMTAKAFHVSEDCISCGKCASACPLGNIVMRDGRPLWGNDCTHCMACISLCPVQAVEFGRLTQGRRRYQGPKSVLKEEQTIP